MVPALLGPLLGLASGMGVARLWCRWMTLPPGRPRVAGCLMGAIYGASAGVISTLAIHLPLALFLLPKVEEAFLFVLVGLVLGLICGTIAGAVCGAVCGVCVTLAERAGLPGLRK
ncbi:MAG: hypothetical protein BWX88_00119 [Planctomycetes bacterium ADurb.Bin126]|nr:MAG: hypothetical protein BWX88_00119 [Planctomycetes bacterium ADurb.Bin126]HOD82211.1 hypothetical protein [Phycisphaerae bacterium]HQL73083.1 hypothetical protein [Phycisphaerae bacterium]